MLAIDQGDDFRGPAAKAEEQANQHWLSVTMSLDELLPDANGEIVILCAGGDCRLNIVTEQRIGGSGTASHHLTEDGYNVDGFAYCAFEGGKTLYYTPDLTLSIARPDRC